MLYVKGFLVALQGVPVTVGVTLIAMSPEWFWALSWR